MTLMVGSVEINASFKPLLSPVLAALPTLAEHGALPRR